MTIRQIEMNGEYTKTISTLAHNVLGLLLTFIIISQLGFIWYNRINDVRQSEQIRQNKALLVELRTEFNSFQQRESRDAPAVARVKEELEKQAKLIKDNANKLHANEIARNKIIAEFSLLNRMSE